MDTFYLLFFAYLIVLSSSFLFKTGSNESAIEALEKLQKMDAEQFQKVFSALKELQKGQQFNAEQIQIAFSRLEELQKGQLLNAEQIKSMQEHLNSLQERLANVEEKVGTLIETVADHGSNIADLTETVADQEKIMLTCCVVASVIAVAAISFIGFCIYQGIKSEREKQKSLSDTSDMELNNLGPNTRFGTDDKPINLQVDGQDNVLQITHL